MVSTGPDQAKTLRREPSDVFQPAAESTECNDGIAARPVPRNPAGAGAIFASGRCSRSLRRQWPGSHSRVTPRSEMKAHHDEDLTRIEARWGHGTDPSVPIAAVGNPTRLPRTCLTQSRARQARSSLTVESHRCLPPPRSAKRTATKLLVLAALRTIHSAQSNDTCRGHQLRRKYSLLNSRGDR